MGKKHLNQMQQKLRYWRNELDERFNGPKHAARYARAASKAQRRLDKALGDEQLSDLDTIDSNVCQGNCKKCSKV